MAAIRPNCVDRSRTEREFERAIRRKCSALACSIQTNAPRVTVVMEKPEMLPRV